MIHYKNCGAHWKARFGGILMLDVVIDKFRILGASCSTKVVSDATKMQNSWVSQNLTDAQALGGNVCSFHISHKRMSMKCGINTASSNYYTNSTSQATFSVSPHRQIQF